MPRRWIDTHSTLDSLMRVVPIALIYAFDFNAAHVDFSTHEKMRKPRPPQ